MAKVVVLPRQGGKSTAALVEYDRLQQEGANPVLVCPNVRRVQELKVAAPHAAIVTISELKEFLLARRDPHSLLIFDDAEWCLSSYFNRSVAMITVTSPAPPSSEDPSQTTPP